MRESFARCWFCETVCNPAGAHGGKGALRLPGHFPVGKFAEQIIFLWQPWTALGVAATNTQLAPLHFNRASRMTGASSHFRIREFAQKCQVFFLPRFPDRITGWKSQLEAVKAHRGNPTTNEPRQILVWHGAEQFRFAWSPSLVERSGLNA